MSRKRITATEDSATLLLPQEIIDQLGLQQGDEVDVSVVDRTVILRPLDESERAQRLRAVTESVFESRADAYEELARGAK
jgi:antitoxin component of MazEF toxin-antitoxin module